MFSFFTTDNDFSCGKVILTFFKSASDWIISAEAAIKTMLHRRRKDLNAERWIGIEIFFSMSKSSEIYQHEFVIEEQECIIKGHIVLKMNFLVNFASLWIWDTSWDNYVCIQSNSVIKNTRWPSKFFRYNRYNQNWYLIGEI